MKKIAYLVLLAVTASIAITSGASAGNTSMPRHVTKRTQAEGYNYFASSNEEPVQYNVVEPLEFEVKAKERWATIALEDKTAMEVGAHVSQDVDGDGTADKEWEVCGETPAPIKIAGGAPLTLTPGSCAQGGRATSGTAYVTLFAATKPPAPAPRVERNINFMYTGWVFTNDEYMGTGGFRIPAYSTDLYIDVNASDMSGLPVNIQVEPENGRVFNVCGSSDEPVAIEPGSEIWISVSPTPCPDGTPAAMTQGEVEVTLSNQP